MITIKKSHIILFFIVILGAFFRFYNLNWDQNFHLHPDERFLTMVGNAMRIPQSFSDYLNPNTSTFNPPNVGYGFFVYGIFPLTINKIFAVLFNTDNYNDFTIQGRFLSALVDTLLIFVIYKTVELLEKKCNFHSSIKLWASFFYAIAVLPIQLSHFFAVDTFLNTFAFASFYFTLRYVFLKNIRDIIISGVFFGLALACKISAVYLLPLLLILFIRSAIPLSNINHPISFTLSTFNKKNILNTRIIPIIKMSRFVIFFAFIVYVTLRLTNPYFFDSSNILNPKISSAFVENIKALKSWENSEIFPPSLQWVNKKAVIFALQNLVLYGISVPYFVAVVLGLFFILKKPKMIDLLIPTIWTLGFFIYQSTQVVKSMRYFFLLYPFLAIFAAIGISNIQIIYTWRKKIIILLIILLLWPLSFISIYTKKHSRVTASEWIYENIPSGSIVLGEYWDDPLPLSISNTYGKQFKIELLPIFDPDTQEKWQKMNELLNRSNYLVLSSNRGWGSIPTVPERHPLTTKFYSDLFHNKLSYKKIKEFTSYPSLKYLGIPLEFPDDLADEGFTVFDHPKVLIFQNVRGIK